jgi:hypothetical protein
MRPLWPKSADPEDERALTAPHNAQSQWDSIRRNRRDAPRRGTPRFGSA